MLGEATFALISSMALSRSSRRQCSTESCDARRKTIATSRELWQELVRTRECGPGVDDQESEVGVNCIAVPVRLAEGTPPIGAVGVSALAIRTPLADLVARVDEIRSVISEYRVDPEISA